MASANQPILSRLDRLDAMMGYLEEIKGCNKSGKSSCASTPTASSGVMVTTTSDGGNSSANSSPKSLEKRCRPIDSVMMETQVKGSLVDRLVLLESRLMKLSLLLEEEIKIEKEEEEHKKQKRSNRKGGGLKRLVESCVGAKPKHTN